MPKLHEKLPDFLIIGAQKAGSTWLASRIGTHPDIFMPQRELHFFNRDYAKGPDFYLQKFADARPGQRIGEKTPDYLTAECYSGEATGYHDRIFEYMPDAKILVVLRNPVQRAVSAICHHMWHRRFSPFEDVDNLLFGTRADKAEKWRVLSNGLYARQIEGLYKTFPAENIRIWIFEQDIRQDSQKTLRDALSFIGVDPNFTPPAADKKSNRSVTSQTALKANYRLPKFSIAWQVLDRVINKKFQMDDAVVNRLYAFYEDENKRLETLLGRELPEWRP